MLKEAKRLYDLGFAVHLLREKSKAPVKSGWSSGVRDPFPLIEKSYRPGLGLGVRLGEPSALIGEGYLCVVDVDLKSESSHHEKEAFAVVDEYFPGLRLTAPFVKTGRGYHFYGRTLEPLQSGKVKTSNDEVIVYSPSSEVNQRQQSKLDSAQLKAGYRVKNAWEVEFMSVGKQVVLPPTLHVDTGAPYAWARVITAVDDLPYIKAGDIARKPSPGRMGGSKIIEDFEPVVIDLLDGRLSDQVVKTILDGEGVTDRSASCLSVSISMARAGFGDIEILSILTDQTTFLGETAYDHRKTKSRKMAAAWVRDYCLKPARDFCNADRAFEEECGVTPLLGTDEEIRAQTAELTDEGDWRWGIQRTGKEGDGPPKDTLNNVILILTCAISPLLFKRNIFKFVDTYGCAAPWGGKEGEELRDEDVILVTSWLGTNYRFEPRENTIRSAMVYIALKNQFHPVVDELNALPDWDGKGRLDNWLIHYFEAKGDPEYVGQVFRKWMIAAVKRIFEPGAKFDWMMILEGDQDLGKSSFGKIIVGEKYFVDRLPQLGDKDAALTLQGIWGIEMAELDQLRRNEIETIKAFITCTVDKVRPPYGRKVVEMPRQCVFFGTTNKDTYLKDETGNRRFKPVKVGRLNFDQLKKDRDQLLAEALFIYQNKLDTVLDIEGDARIYQKEIHEEKMVDDESELMLEEIIRGEENEDGFSQKLDPNGFHINMLFGENGHLKKWKGTNWDIQMASKTLKRLNYERIKLNGKRCWKLKKQPKRTGVEG